MAITKRGRGRPSTASTAPDTQRAIKAARSVTTKNAASKNTGLGAVAKQALAQQYDAGQIMPSPSGTLWGRVKPPLNPQSDEAHSKDPRPKTSHRKKALITHRDDAAGVGKVVRSDPSAPERTISSQGSHAGVGTGASGIPDTHVRDLGADADDVDETVRLGFERVIGRGLPHTHLFSTGASEPCNTEDSPRRQLVQLTNQYALLELNYLNLQHVAVKEAEENFERLKKQAEDRAKGMNTPEYIHPTPQYPQWERRLRELALTLP
jgi:hypothetical protein